MGTSLYFNLSRNIPISGFDVLLCHLAVHQRLHSLLSTLQSYVFSLLRQTIYKVFLHFQLFFIGKHAPQIINLL